MNTSQLPYFVAIATTGSLSAASKQLGISQPALTKYLDKLEKEQGIPLFFRSRRQYILTAAGKLYLQTSLMILEQLQHTRTAIHSLGSEQERTHQVIRLGLSPNRGISSLSHIFPEFDRRFPDVELKLTEGYANDLMEKLLAGDVDLIITSHAGKQPPEAELIPIQEEELVLAVPSFHPSVHHSSVYLDELPYAELRDFGDSVFSLPEPSSSLYALVSSVFESANFHPRCSVSTPNISMQIAMIRSGARVGFLPAYYIRPDSGMAYFRIRRSPKLTSAFLFQKDHRLTEPERFLFYLLFKWSISSGVNYAVKWSELSQKIFQEFDSLLVAGGDEVL